MGSKRRFQHLIFRLFIDQRIYFIHLSSQLDKSSYYDKNKRNEIGNVYLVFEHEYSIYNYCSSLYLNLCSLVNVISD